MSLTSALDDQGSWVNRFFKSEFPKLTDFCKREGTAVKALPLKVPPRTHGQVRLVGTAFDYRLRLHLKDDLARSLVLADGVDRMQQRGSGLDPTVDSAWVESTRRLLRERPVGDRMALARASVVLAWMHDGYRSGGRWSEGMKKIARSLNQSSMPTWHEYGVSVDQEVAGEVAALFDAASECLPAAAVCGPEFAGSRAVEGADADLIVGRCLYEVKPSSNPRDKLPRHLRQLIGYALLDWNDAYGLERAGFYFSRQAERKSWPLSKLLAECTGAANATLAGLRGQFRRLANENSAA